MSDKKKTPSARVIAAMLAHDKLINHGTSLDPGALSNLSGSRVSDKKASKVREHLGKLTNKLVERMAKILDKFKNPPAPKKAGTRPNFAKKK